MEKNSKIVKPLFKKSARSCYLTYLKGGWIFYDDAAVSGVEEGTVLGAAGDPRGPEDQPLAALVLYKRTPVHYARNALKEPISYTL